MQKHKFPYNWRLSEAKFTKDKGKVFSCFACGGGSTMGYKLAGFDVIGCNETEAMPEIGTNCILRVEYQNLDDGEWYTDYLTSTWGKFGWAEDYLERIADIANEYRITHWKPINKPKGVEE